MYKKHHQKTYRSNVVSKLYSSLSKIVR